MIEGLAVRTGPEAVVVAATRPLRVLSSAVLHVDKDDPCADPPAMLEAYLRRTGVPEPFVGLLTGAWTEAAVIGRGIHARFGGPTSEFGWSAAQAARRALEAGTRGWQERNP